MKIIQRSHLFIVAALLVVAASVWGIRFASFNAGANALKPAMVSHQENVKDPASGGVHADAATDLADGEDRTTFTSVYLNGEGNSEVLFYDFDDPSVSATEFTLGIVYAFKQKAGDDGFSIQYSTSGSGACSDSTGRSWQTIDEIETEEGKLVKRVNLTGVSPNEVCVKIDALVNGDADDPGYEFRNSNELKVYDIWLDEPDADVKMEIRTQSSRFAVGEDYEYTVIADNIGTGLAQSTTAKFTLPDNVSYVQSRQTKGSYDPVSGVWSIGDIGAGESESLVVVVHLDAGRVGDRVNTTASTKYHDIGQAMDGSHGSSATVTISDVASGIEVSGIESITQEIEAAQVEEAVETEDVTSEAEQVIAEQNCDVLCELSGFFLYIVNPDGTARDTLSDFARVSVFEDRYFHVSFEDKGSDMDYNDIAFDLDIRDCRNVQVTMTDMNAGWHHQVKATIFYDDVVQQEVTIWVDSHEGVNQTKTYDLSEYIQLCSE